jgi:hypothetical protein
MTYDLIDRTVRRANPVPDPARLDHKPPLALGAHAPEGLTMQLIERPTDQRPPDEGPRRSRWVVLAGAAAAVVVAFLVGMIVANRDAAPSAPADSIGPVETLDTAPPPEPTLLTRAMEFNPIPAGEYVIDTDGDPDSTLLATLTIEGDRWFAAQPGVGRDEPNGDYSFALLAAEVDRVNAAGCDTTRFIDERGGDLTQWTDVDGAGARQVAELLAGMPDVAVIDPVAEMTAFGYPAIHLTLGMPDCGQRDHGYIVWEGPTFGRNYDPGMTAEYWVLDVDGTTVLVEASWHADSLVEDRNALWDAIGTLEITP